RRFAACLCEIADFLQRQYIVEVAIRSHRPNFPVFRQSCFTSRGRPFKCWPFSSRIALVFRLLSRSATYPKPGDTPATMSRTMRTETTENPRASMKFLNSDSSQSCGTLERNKLAMDTSVRVCGFPLTAVSVGKRH